MARLARADIFDPTEVSVFHCINRCVRQCFLCGQDPKSGANYDHRKAWLEERLRFLSGKFGIDVLNFAVLSNHFHVVLRNRPDIVAAWSDDEVATRWLRLRTPRRAVEGDAAEPTAAEIGLIRNDPDRLSVIRRRLSDISWFMRMIAEPIARRANQEERTNGRFWQGRFRAVRLCDEAAVLACAVYVDLNPIRAGLAQTAEDSDFTSVQRRIESLEMRADSADRPDAWLAPVSLNECVPDEEPSAMPDGQVAAAGEPTPADGPLPGRSGKRASDNGYLPLSLADYLELFEWTGRQVVGGCGSIPDCLPGLPERLGISAANWLRLVTGFGRLFHRVAGAPHSLARVKFRRRFWPGRAVLLGSR